VIFNVSGMAKPGDIVDLQGTAFGANPTIWCSTNGGTAVQLSVVNGGNGIVQVQMPSPQGLYSLFVKDGATASNTVFANQAKPMHFDTPEVTASGTFRIFGRNLYLSGATPQVTFESGASSYTATVNASPAFNKLSVTAPASIPNGTYNVYVSNGYGTYSTAKALCQQQMTVRSGGTDTFSLGVPWAADYTFGSNVYNVKTDSRLTSHAVGDGVTNDQPAIQNAINVASAAGGGVVYLPAGTYKLQMSGNGALMNFGNNVVVQGAGQGSTTINYGYGTPPSGGSWCAIFYQVSKCGLCDLTINNLNQGNAWLNTGSIANGGGNANEIFLARVSANIANGQRIELEGDRMVVKNCSLSSTYTLLFMLGSTNSRVFNNTFTQQLGVHLDVTETNRCVVENNTFNLDANNGALVTGNVRHGMAIGFGHNLAILNNTFSVFNGTPTYNNDGESILSEGGAGGRTGEETGTVTSASGTTINVSKSIGFIANTAIAIIKGTGTGQWRNITARSGSAITIDSAWQVNPDNTSTYATFIWSDQNDTIDGNTFTGWLRGIWSYQGATVDTQISNNHLNGMDGIFLMPCQNVNNGNGQFDPVWNNIVNDNVLTSSASTATYINLTGDLQQTTSLIGTMAINNVIYNNSVTGTGATFFENDPAWTEGYCNYLRVEASPYNDQSIPAMLGTIFQYNTATNCGSQAYLLNGGAYQTTIANYTNSGNPTFVNDSSMYWNTSGTHGSVSTVILGGAPASPTSLGATAGNAQVTLNWTGSAGATSYNVYRGTSAGGESATPIATGITGATYTNSGLTNGTTYYYKVAAVNGSGTSGQSNEASATPTSVTNTGWVTGTTAGTVRNDYSGFVGMKFTTGASSVTVSQLGRWVVSGNTGSHTVKLTLASTGVDVSGGSVTVNTSGQTAGQYAYVNLSSPITLPASTAYYLSTNETVGGDSWLDSNTTLSTSGVASCNNAEFYASGWVAGNSTANTSFGPVSFAYTGTGGGSAPAAPTGLGATAGSAQVSLSWTASSGATSYNVYRGTTAGGESATALYTGITGTTKVDTGLTNGTTYFYKVKAVNASGTSGYSNEASATPTAATTNWVTGTTAGTVRNNYTGFVGMKFTTGSSSVTVKALGRWIVSGNTGSHTVKLTLASTGVDVSGGSVTVNTSGQTAGAYAYVNLSSPITLPANTAYYLTTNETNAGDSWLDANTTLTTTGVASCNNAEYYASGWVAGNSTANTSFGAVSFQY